MKLKKRIITAFACICTLLSAQAAFAGYITYTYTSQPLDWKSTTLHHTIELGPDAPEGEEATAFFQFSFRLLDTLLSTSGPTSLGIVDPIVSMGPGEMWSGQFKTTSKGNITVNSDGSVAAWDIDLHLIKMIVNPADAGYMNAARTNMTIFTSGGAKSCNCDLLRMRSNMVLPRHEHYVAIGPMQTIYSDSNSFNSWSVVREANVKVAEPGMASLILMSLGLLGLRQIRRRHQTA